MFKITRQVGNPNFACVICVELAIICFVSYVTNRLQSYGYFGFSTSEELRMAIEDCKEMIKSDDSEPEKKKHLVKKLVQLKLKLQEIMDTPEEPATDLKVVLGHNFEVRSLERPKQYCEKCCGIIWGVMTNWYHCISKKFLFHLQF
ncbi:UNVERIFIED_CONTAM: Def8 [Trichonephila clavipes]